MRPEEILVVIAVMGWVVVQVIGARRYDKN